MDGRLGHAYLLPLIEYSLWVLHVSNTLLLLCFSGTLELRGTGGNSAVLTANTGNKWGGIRLVNSNGT